MRRWYVIAPPLSLAADFLSHPVRDRIGANACITDGVTIGDHAVIAHGRAVRGAALAPFMASAAMRGTARYFADGEVGPASAAERQLYYAGIAWEIAGEPLTVVRKPGETLVVVLDEQGQLFQLDTLGPWYRLVTGETSEITQYQPTAATQP